uniref:Gustatory receptor n=1 Tax=Tetranychus urticae TaxID=32264 RepID=T1K0U7_TETUR
MGHKGRRKYFCCKKVNFNPNFVSSLNSSSSFLQKILDSIDRLSEPSKLVKLIDHLERSSIVKWICINGYSQTNKPARSKLIFNIFLCLWCYANSLRHLIIAFVQDESLRILLGDSFIGYPAYSLLNIIFAGAAFLMGSIKTALVYSESQSRMKILNVFGRLRDKSFDRSIWGMTKNCDLKFRRLTCLTSYSLDIFIVIAVGSVVIIQVQAMILSASISVRTFVIQLAWLSISNIAVYFSGLAAYWFFVHTIIFISLSIQSSSSAIIRVDRLIKSLKVNYSHSSTMNVIQRLIQMQNAHYNTIAILNDNFGLSVFIAFFVGSLYADLLFFCGTYVRTRNILLDFLLFFTGFITIGTITQYNLFASGSFKKIEKFRKAIYRLSVNIPFDLETRLKLITTLERMSTYKIGFYIGNIFCIDDYHCFIFLLENISLYLLLITTISKATTN